MKQIFLASERANVKHRLRLKHHELTQGFEHTPSHPLWKRSARQMSSYIKWITGASRAFADRINYEIDDEKSCRLCNREYAETRAHLISNSDATSAERVKFRETLEEISIEKSDEYDMLPETSKWKWILAGGILRSIKHDNINKNRIPPLQSPLKK